MDAYAGERRGIVILAGQVALGDLMAGWLCKEPAGTLTFEGGLAHVPAFVAEPIELLVARFRRGMAPLAETAAWKRRAADLPLPLIAGLIEQRESPQLPTLVNTNGDPLELVTAHYRVRDHEQVLAALSDEFQENGDGSYCWVDDAGTVLARLEVARTKLRVEVNSRKRLAAAQKRLEKSLGGAVERSLEAHEDIEQAVRARATKAQKPGSKAEPLELPPELAAEVHKMVLAKIRSTLDEPIPQFKGKTLRQVARSPKSRPDAISWLRQQERLLKSNPQLADLDVRPLWQELALPFQGLETDPPR